jgi:FkbM family methyltransferase
MLLGDSGLARRLIWRTGRKLYMYARGEGPNDPHTNGEYWLLERVLGASRQGPTVLLDVGANVGDWSAEALRLAPDSTTVEILAIEPSPATCAMLTARFGDRRNVAVHECALSAASGHAAFYSSSDGAGTNSLSPLSGPTTETVRVMTMDELLLHSAPGAVAMAKIDAEGADALILRGAERALTSGAIEVIQFEYNWRWLLFHQSLRDIFELIAGKPYRLAKLVNRGLHYYEIWHPELDRFFECNYLLVRNDTAFTCIGSRVCFDHANVAKIPSAPSNRSGSGVRPSRLALSGTSDKACLPI